MKLTLHPNSYDWKFLPVAGSTFTDSGSATVHDAPPGPNSAPVAVADSYSTPQSTAKVVPAPGVLGNDTDADSDPLTAALVSDVSHGTLSLSPDGGFTYTPTSGYTGADSFTYKANDGTADSNTVTVSITVTASATYYVDKTNGACSDAGPGTQAQPFCTIGKGASVATAGKTVRVLAGTYAETVNGPNSGTAGNPITYSAAPGVMVTGNGTATGNAFRISTKSYITVDGFTVSGTVDYGIYVASSNHITIANNHVTLSGSPVSGGVRAGIYLNATTDSTVSGNTSDHNSQDGIRLTNGCTGVTVRDNVAFANAEQWERNATGIHVNGSSANTIIHNTTYANEDSGLQFYVNAHDNLVIGNLSYGNGDHGIDNNASPNNVIVGNSVQGNHTAGINLEGASAPGSGGATLANNIAVDNGINPVTGQKSNIRVDSQSLTGTTLDYDLVFLTAANGGTVEIIWGATSYTSLAFFKTGVPGQEVHGLQADPLWIGPAAPAGRPPAVTVGDYHLGAGSPAIDSANSGAPNESATDLDGHARVDDPATTDTGAGARTYDDRGALEFVPTSGNHPPVAVADSYSTPQDTTLTVAAPGVLGNDTDADLNPLTAIKVTDPAHGTLTLGSNGSIGYVPTAGYSGPDSFTYKANDGTADSNTVTVSLTVTAAPNNMALQLNGSSQYATLGGSSDLRSATFTVELWFKRTDAGVGTSTGTGGIASAIPLIAKGRAEGETAAQDINYFLGIDATSGKLVADFEEGAGGSSPSANHPITGTTAIPIGTAWHHAAATYNGAAWNLYLDGALDGTLAVNQPANAATTSLTAAGSALTTTGTAAGFFAGVVDEVRIWNSARTLAQIQATKDTEITAPQSGLLGVWNLNEGTGSSLADHSGNGKTGAAVASPAWVAGFVPPAGNGAPAAPTLNAPANGGTGVGLSPTLDIGVSDPDSDPLTVTYFGRPLASGNFAQIAQHTGVASGSNDTASWAGLGAGQTFEWYATVNDGTHTTTGPTWTFHTTPSADPVFVGIGDIASCSITEDTATGNIVKGIDGSVFTVGDNVYPSGTAADFTNCYATTPWGDPSVKSRTRPIPGNHDWGDTGTASDNLNGYNGYFGAAATDANGKSYYSYDIPSSNWHIVNLDSECEDVPGGCAAGSPQELWLKADLAANSGKNVIALWHKPRYSSGATQYQAVQPLWDDLYAAGADILLDGHDHVYERTAPEKSGATLSSPPVADPTYGIRQFTVGTGGEGHHGLVTPLPTSEVRNDQTFGIFKLTLHASSYDWKFLPIDGSTFTDSGTGTVHGAPVPAGLTELQAGESLTPGNSIASPNGQYRLTMQSDGNVVEYDGASVVWASGTNPAGAIALMQNDGNFVINNSTGNPLWASDTSGNPGAYVVLGNAGQFGVRSASGGTLWAPGRLSTGGRLLSGQSLYSPAGRFRLTMQGDGNLVEYSKAGTPVWASGTGVPGSKAIVQDDGNVVVYNGSNQALWATDTSGHPGAYVQLNDLGQLTVSSATDAVLWAGPGELAPNTKLTSGQSVFSTTRAFRLTLQGDGNLVEYDAANTVVWASGTSAGSRLAMQGDGNLVLYDSANHVLWTSNTSGKPGAHLTLLDTGQLLVNNAAGAPIWGGPGSAPAERDPRFRANRQLADRGVPVDDAGRRQPRAPSRCDRRVVVRDELGRRPRAPAGRRKPRPLQHHVPGAVGDEHRGQPWRVSRGHRRRQCLASLDGRRHAVVRRLRSPRSTVRTLALIATAAATVLATSALAVAAYGPVAPPGPAVPGGFSIVISSRTIGPNGGTMSGKTGHTRLRLKVPAHALARRVQLTFTRPRLSGLRHAIQRGKHLVVGFALLANKTNGAPIAGSFSRRPVSTTVANRTFTRRTQVLAWSPARRRFVRFAAVVRTGYIVVSARHYGEFLVISPR